MKVKYYFGKKNILRVEWSGNENDEVIAYNFGTEDVVWIGELLGNYPSKQAFFEKCISSEELERRIISRQVSQSAEYQHAQFRKAVALVNSRNEMKKKAYDELFMKGLPIEVNLANLRIVLAYLNTQNWGSWELPQMSIGYRCNQYACDGKIATTIILDSPIDYYGAPQTKFVYGAPRGHLSNYHRL